MKQITEQLNDAFFRTKEGGATPITLSSLLFPDANPSESERKKEYSKISSFFRETGGFTYEDFKSIIKIDVTKIDFKKGYQLFQSGQKGVIENFAKIVKSTDKGGGSFYDEYVETFFIYFYYQLFVKLFSKSVHDRIISANKDSIESAKKQLADVKQSLIPDMEENVLRLYKSFYYTFASSIADPALMKDEAAQEKYFENFANLNINLFREYPLSAALKGSETMSIKVLIDSIFDVISKMDEANISNRQIASVKMLSDFISGTTIDFDITQFQKLSKERPSILSDSKSIQFPESLRPVIDNIIKDLSDVNDVSDFGFSWAKGTSWEPYIKLMCGIISLEGVFSNVKKFAEATQGGSFTYEKKLDVAEKDGGVYSINNDAFVLATKDHAQIKNVVEDLNKLIIRFSKKTKYFQDLSGQKLIKALFVEYDEKFACEDIEELPKEEFRVIENIMKITGIIPGIAPTVTQATAAINGIMFGGEINPSNDNLVAAIQYAKENCGDFKINETRVASSSTFSISSAYKTVKDVASATAKTFGDIFNDISSGNFSNIAKSFTRTFSDEFSFAKMESTASGFQIKIDNEVVYDLKSAAEVGTYIKNMCVSAGSMMYHSVVKFGQYGTYESRYKDYFNVLTLSSCRLGRLPMMRCAPWFQELMMPWVSSTKTA